MFESLKITFDMFTPVAFPLKKQAYPIHLDALIISLMTSSKKQFYTPENDFYAPGNNNEVPLAVYGDKSPVYCASVAMAEEFKIGTYGITKKPPRAEEMKLFKKGSSSFNPEGDGAGIHRAWAETVPTVHPTQIWFECQGIKEELWKILTKVRRIGVFRRVGLGEVANIHIEPCENTMAGLIYNDQPARMLPVADWPQGEQKKWNKVVAATKAPYWFPGNKELCWAPPTETTIPNISVVDY
ncbi:hypothetical protein [Syntrophomonas palmitatica]|uniref:hypothetical protein n=1 Tax=Syntrophomonas palmitatica TaxID=402877 RepID=UPI0006D27974|nr:hypothetical protein [Syntrophomonas palmitatica]